MVAPTECLSFVTTTSLMFFCSARFTRGKILNLAIVKTVSECLAVDVPS
jgi:hypothetical protein